ncbi:hypothetical protein [Chondrinema litorale]|uniref:hypothetical protein n=1 Tax=Chondrinema litorale TaxID=2994555 RepID=UPI002543B0C2|nr:hypothetical protein [Chondrinema litorale]UZR95212.1 hypothetical protein OQ292_05190 [Chondrinema litorale]
MKTSYKVVAILALVLGSLALFAFLMFYVAIVWLAILQVILSVMIIIFCVKYFRLHKLSSD